MTAELRRPPSPGPHPGIVICLGVMPLEVEDPQIPRLLEALTRAGFVTLPYWSPHMRDFRLDKADVENLAKAYEWLVTQPYVDATRSGLFGACVGGSFALLAAASRRIADRVSFVGAFSPYASVWSLAQDIATETRLRNGSREPWQVDENTRKVFVHTLTAHLEPGEAARLREAMVTPDGEIDPNSLSPAGQVVYPLLTRLPLEQVDRTLARLPAAVRSDLEAISPAWWMDALESPVIVLMHDYDDPVIPRTESLRLQGILAGRRGLHHTEFVMFRHLDPTKVRLSLLPLLRELGRFYLALYPMFRRAAG